MKWRVAPDCSEARKNSNLNLERYNRSVRSLCAERGREREKKKKLSMSTRYENKWSPCKGGKTIIRMPARWHVQSRGKEHTNNLRSEGF